ncbi:cyclin-dependent kinase inhibitor 1B [Tachyglossus aculeatus]|uniref:cyclin-dependent kinase inhibitor 1B n=1 Tax=Tachyglossus aculeatus TaxID=9261 RepID=UPI0018F6E1E5|nr:cyclin-dependent kinase inhibitor 1B [Tachyglossus aculeatus]
MSDVRVSSGSPTLERMEAPQPERDHPKPSACRNLFGPVDHAELARDLRRHCRDLAEACRRRWNFDFRRHRPLDGRYEWRPVEGDGLPDFYRRPPPPPRGARPGDPAPHRQDCDRDHHHDDDDDDDDEGEDTHLAGRKTDASERQTGFPDRCPAPRKRPAPDDSSPPTKRAHPTEEGVPGGAPGTGAVEQTPEKPSLRRRQT